MEHAALPEAHCANCKLTWKAERGVICATCKSAYHQHCFQANGGCLRYQCREARVDRLEVPRDPTVTGIGKDNCNLCGRVCERGDTMECPTCARQYHFTCWRPNNGCMRGSCRTAPEALAPPAQGARLQPISFLGIPLGYASRAMSLPELFAQSFADLMEALGEGLWRRRRAAPLTGSASAAPTP